MTDPEKAPVEYPEGEFAILELFGHTTLVGRIAEVERFGTKMLAIEPLFNDALLPVSFHGGAAIYRMQPCSVEVAFAVQPRHGYQLPPIYRLQLLPHDTRSSVVTDDDDDDHPF